MRDMDELFEALAKSEFRRRFRLRTRERKYLQQKGIDAIRAHADNFVRERLAPAHPANDGRQTPMRNHPVFVAQHATGTCCRGCLAKWHRIPKGRPLTEEQIEYIVDVITCWIEMQRPSACPDQPRLF